MPVALRAQSVLSRNLEISFLQKKPKSRDLSVFFRSFVSIFDAGVPVISALAMLAEQTANKMLAAAIADIRRRVETGESLTSAMRAHVKIFGEMCVSITSAGEISGSLATSFRRMAEQYERDAKIRLTLKKASVYPIVILIVTVAVIALMLTMVVPTFEDIFAQLGGELPAITRFVVSLSELLRAYWYVVFALAVGTVTAVKAFSKTDSGRYLFSRISLKTPLLGAFITKSSAARFSRTLSTLIAAGFPLIEALEIVARTMKNLLFREAILNARDVVSMGSALSETLRNSKIFPPLVHQMLNIGEESGNIEGMLSKIADYYQEETETATKTLMSILEPAIIVLLALVVGVIIMSIIIPMGEIYSQLENL